MSRGGSRQLPGEGQGVSCIVAEGLLLLVLLLLVLVLLVLLLVLVLLLLLLVLTVRSFWR